MLLLRLSLGLRVIYIGTVSLFGKPSEPITLGQSLIAVAGGIFLLAGLWTPIIGTLLAIDEVWIALSLLCPGAANARSWSRHRPFNLG